MRFAIAAIMCALMAPSVSAATIYVDGILLTIQAGIDKALPGDTVLVAPGTYVGPGNRDLDLGGKDLVLLSEAGPESTIIDCQASGRGFYIHSGETEATLIKGFTVQNAYCYSNGGGFYINYASPCLEDIIIRDCRGGHGAGIAASEGSLNFERVTIVNNSVVDFGNGGGIYLYDVSAILTECRIDSNGAARGGGIQISNSTMTLQEVQICHNHADISGGGVSAGYNSLTFQDVLIEGNTAANNLGGGMNINGESTSGTLTNVRFIGNHADNSGGAIHMSHCYNLTIDSCLIIGNSCATGGSAGISCGYFSTPVLRNLTIMRNTSGSNKAAVSSWYYSSVTLENSIVAFNEDGGIWTQLPATMDVICCDVFGNEGGDYLGDIGDQTGINGNISEDPLTCDNLYPPEPYTLRLDSPCLPENNDCGVLMGMFGAGCDPTGIPNDTVFDRTSWGALKSLY